MLTWHVVMEGEGPKNASKTLRPFHFQHDDVLSSEKKHPTTPYLYCSYIVGCFNLFQEYKSNWIIVSQQG